MSIYIYLLQNYYLLILHKYLSICENIKPVFN